MSRRKERSDLLREVAEMGMKEERLSASELEGVARLTLRLPRNLWRSLKVYAAQNDTTIQKIVTDLIQEFLEREKRKEKETTL